MYSIQRHKVSYVRSYDLDIGVSYDISVQFNGDIKIINSQDTHRLFSNYFDQSPSLYSISIIIIYVTFYYFNTSSSYETSNYFTHILSSSLLCQGATDMIIALIY